MTSDATTTAMPRLPEQRTAVITGAGGSAGIGRVTARMLAEYDMLIAADICFWDELVDPVANMVNRAVKAGVKHILIADPERSTFATMAERCVQRHCAELVSWQTRAPISATGAILVVENA